MISLNRNFKPKFNVYFFCSDNITPGNSKTICYKELHLSRCSGGLSIGVACIFMRGGRKSIIMDFLDFSFNLFNTCIKFQGHIPSASYKLLNLNQEHP